MIISTFHDVDIDEFRLGVHFGQVDAARLCDFITTSTCLSTMAFLKSLSSLDLSGKTLIIVGVSISSFHVDAMKIRSISPSSRLRM